MSFEMVFDPTPTRLSLPSLDCRDIPPSNTQPISPYLSILPARGARNFSAFHCYAMSDLKGKPPSLIMVVPVGGRDREGSSSAGGPGGSESGGGGRSLKRSSEQLDVEELLAAASRNDVIKIRDLVHVSFTTQYDGGSCVSNLKSTGGRVSCS